MAPGYPARRRPKRPRRRRRGAGGTIAGRTPDVLAVIEALGVLAFALSGALLGARRGFDVVGIVVLAALTAMGGGVLRDVLLGDTPPAAFREWPYFAAPIVAAAVTLLFHPAIERQLRTVLVLDAAGLGLFCVAGTVKALDHGLDVLPAAALGVTTGVGGGILRDVVARETPVIVSADSELYAIPAAAGALVVAGAWHLDLYAPVLGPVVAAAIFAVRLVALRRGWRAPSAQTLARRRDG
ncbi:MAG TPA: TRIC cation channel family protein [Solirubrobacteraceae bacterium]|nr:TRIC cation channel family protein [Solirubrobacteraceae bacterium]